jgi:hypothetical protein
MGLGMRRVNGCTGATVFSSAIYNVFLQLREWGGQILREEKRVVHR